MKVLVVSDSHGNCTHLRRAITKERPQAVIHLGDGRRDILEVMGDRPQIPLYSVPGNCDLRSQNLAPVQQITLEGVHILLAHGHTFGVKSGYRTYLNYGHRQEADLILSGHTHVACVWEDGGMLLVNPGSVGNGSHPSYAVLELAGGKVLDCEMKEIQDPVYEWKHL